jgi:hypothetical protein
MKRADARGYVVVAIALSAGAVALLTLVASALQTGTLDSRRKHAPTSEPNWILVSQEPIWFYSILAFLSVLAAYLLVFSWRLVRSVRKQR